MSSDTREMRVNDKAGKLTSEYEAATATDVLGVDIRHQVALPGSHLTNKGVCRILAAADQLSGAAESGDDSAFCQQKFIEHLSFVEQFTQRIVRNVLLAIRPPEFLERHIRRVIIGYEADIFWQHELLS